MHRQTSDWSSSNWLICSRTSLSGTNKTQSRRREESASSFFGSALASVPRVPWHTYHHTSLPQVMGHTWRWITPGTFGMWQREAYSHRWVSRGAQDHHQVACVFRKETHFVGLRVKYWGEILIVCCNNLSFPDKINGRSRSFSLRTGAFSISAGGAGILSPAGVTGTRAGWRRSTPPPGCTAAW